MLVISDNWRAAFPTAHAGILAMRGVSNPAQHPGLEELKTALEEQLRAEFGGLERSALEALPILRAYDAYYKRFKKTYHILLQLESVAKKGKPLPRAAALVETMFMAEMKNLILTAGHDLDAVQTPVTLDAARGDESYTLLRGEEQILKAGDMFIRDRAGILSSILYGPDRRTQIKPETRSVIFTVYAPEGVGEQAVREHLEDIQRYIRVVNPEAETENLQVFGAG